MVNSALSRLELTCRDLDELAIVSTEILEFANGLTFWLFDGDMGAGKTTLIKEICHQMGVMDVISSPTYSIINEYQNKFGEKLYHFDFYRINEEEEAMDIGVEEYFDSGNYCFVEWPSKIPSLLPESQFLNLKISVGNNNERYIELTRHEERI